MSTTLQMPSLRRALDDLKRRLTILEQRQVPHRMAILESDLIFSYAGTLTETESPPALIVRNQTIEIVGVAFGTAGSTDTVLALNRNGTTIRTITVPDSTTTYQISIPGRLSTGDKLTLEVATAGTGAADMTVTVHVRYRELGKLDHGSIDPSVLDDL